MEKALQEKDSADFKTFWDARALCLALFKENIPSFLRHQFWAKFSELSREARKLKELLDEESNFAAEQIDIAIGAIEAGLDQIPELLEKESDISLSHDAFALKNRFNFYNKCQKELAHLNLFASRITALRKELIKTEMRVRVKNKFFDRMSKAGDKVFPRRKELIQEISEAFSADIGHFIDKHFSSQESRIPLHDLREEIKALQSAAKLLTLNTQTFSQTRLHLSECWDKLKEKDKERKLEFDKKKEIFKQNAEELKVILEEGNVKFDSGEEPLSASLTFIDSFVSQMRVRELGRDEVKALKEQLKVLQDKVNGKQKEQEEERQKQEEEKAKQKRALFDGFMAQAKTLVEQSEELSLEEILKSKEEFLSSLQKSGLNKAEKTEVEKLLKVLKDVFRAKKERALLTLPQDERLAIQQLKELLLQKREERSEIKERLENYRKLLGSSNLSFEKSMSYNATLAEEKEFFEKAQKDIKEIEVKIEILESKLLA